MTKDQIIEYHLKNEQARYEANKECYKTIKHCLIAFFICVTIIVCSYMYFVMPVEEKIFDASSGSKIVVESSIGRDNINGLQN